MVEYRSIAIHKSTVCIPSGLNRDRNSLGEMFFISEPYLCQLYFISSWIWHDLNLSHVSPFRSWNECMTLFPCLTLRKRFNSVCMFWGLCLFLGKDVFKHTFNLLFSCLFILKSCSVWQTSYAYCFRAFQNKLVVRIIITWTCITRWVVQIVLSCLFLTYFSGNSHSA